jgi:hypothetical protein
MTTISHTRETAGIGGPDNGRPWCSNCGTDAALMIDSIDALRPPREGLVQVCYICHDCGSSYCHPAPVTAVAGILDRPGPGPESGILRFGETYIHCRKPMHSAGSQEHGIGATHRTGSTGERLLDSYLRTRVLRCDCGFQMEIPTDH